MPTLAEFGRINWAIFSLRSGRLITVGLPRGIHEVEYVGKRDLLLLTDERPGAEEEPIDSVNTEPVDELRIDFEFANKRRNAPRLWIRPGFDLKLFGRLPDPKKADLQLRFGDERHELRGEEKPLVQIPRKDWRLVLAAAGLVVSKNAPRLPHHLCVETFNEDYGHLIFNGITGFVHPEPEGDSHLDDGFFWSSRASAWIGAAIDNEHFPKEELQHFFAALKPAARLAIARRLANSSLNTRPLPSYRQGVGFETFPHGGDDVNILRGVAVRHLPEEQGEVFEDAVNYLSTLRPGVTRSQYKATLEALQAVEVGLERSRRPNDIIRGYQMDDSGGARRLHGKNYFVTRLRQLLRLGRNQEAKRSTLQGRWKKIQGKFTKWEAEGVPLLAADWGLCPYPSRVWIAEAMGKARAENCVNTKRHLQHQRELRETQVRHQARLAAMRDDDAFRVRAQKESASYFTLEVRRAGAAVETHTVCRQGARLFCMKSGCDVKKSYTREELRARIAALLKKRAGAGWLESHNFLGLFRNLGIHPEVVAAAA